MKLLMSFLAIGLICVDGSEKVSGNFMYFVCPSVVSRSEWNASAATEINFLEHPVKIAIICHTATPECSSLDTCKRRVKRIQRYHQREKLWGDIAYNFLIGGDGNVYEGIGWNQSGRHTKNFNDISVGIAFIGNFTAKLPSKNALDVAKNLLFCGRGKGYLDENYKLYGARDVSRTESPGMKLNEEIQNWPHWTSLDQEPIIFPR